MVCLSAVISFRVKKLTFSTFSKTRSVGRVWHPSCANKRREIHVQLIIFLDIVEADSLRRLDHAASSAKQAVERAIQMRDYWGSLGRDVIVECDAKAARELASYAHSHCPSAVQKIRTAFRLAHLRGGESRNW